MSQRPTIALAMIVKNEEHNLPRLFESIEGCFDEIHITDTGSTDKTVEVAESLGANVHHFQWVNDFSKARNYSFQFPTTDFICWLDGDDVLTNKDKFIKWRDNAMDLADYWVATYHYAYDENKKPACSFIRERVIRSSKKLQWKYFVHEGLMPESNYGKVIAMPITTWAVQHERTEKDLLQDRSRNLNLFKEHENNLDSRMIFYYGKELFESQKPMEAAHFLEKAATTKDLEAHDRILSIQYACYCSIQCNQFEKAIGFALTGLQLDPHRAEFYQIIGDSYLKLGKVMESIPAFNAAKSCFDRNVQSQIATPIFTFPNVYTSYPRNQLTRIYAQMGMLDKAAKENEECIALYKDKEAENIIKPELIKLTNSQLKTGTLTKDEAIVITTPPGGFYEWDPEIEKTRGIGGSETAVVHMAKHLKDLSGKRVIVFNQREKDVNIDGVEYVSCARISEYFTKYEPLVHIAWRHNIKITSAPTYVWSHDLLFGDAHKIENFDKVFTLSPFHKEFLMSMSPIPEDKIIVTRNGLDPNKFKDLKIEKKGNELVWASSPDRGLQYAMRVMDEVVKEVPDARLNVYYGFDNMIKMGKVAEADTLKKMIAERPYVVNHGNKQQNELLKDYATYKVWLYPTDFMETFCISAIEMLSCKVYPVTRSMGALKDTLKDAKDKGMATLLDHPCFTESQIQSYAQATISALKEDYWQRIDFNPETVSWKSLAAEWLDLWRIQSTSSL